MTLKASPPPSGGLALTPEAVGSYHRLDDSTNPRGRTWIPPLHLSNCLDLGHSRWACGIQGCLLCCGGHGCGKEGHCPSSGGGACKDNRVGVAERRAGGCKLKERERTDTPPGETALAYNSRVKKSKIDNRRYQFEIFGMGGGGR